MRQKNIFFQLIKGGTFALPEIVTELETIAQKNVARKPYTS